MKISKIMLAVICLLTANELFGQNIIKQDSFFFDRGVEGTQDFTPRKRSIVTEHDSEGKALEIITYEFSPGGQWIHSVRRQFSYQDGELVDLQIQGWNNSAQTWEDAQRRLFTYNGDGKLIQRQYAKAPSSGMPLQPDRRWTYAYDGQNRLENLLLQVWNGGVWENNSRQMWTYDNQGLLTEHRLQTWDGMNWNGSRLRSMSYDPSHQGLTEVLGQQWSQGVGWTNTRRKSFNYNFGGLWSGMQMQTWDNANLSWENEYRQLLTHNLQNQFETRIRQIWENEAWINQFKAKYQYSAQEMNALMERWDEGQSQWFPSNRYQIDFGAAGQIQTSQGWQRWNEQTLDWENDETTLRYRYFWSPLTTPVAEVKTPSACTVPNPYIIGTPFECDFEGLKGPVYLELYDLTGRSLHNAAFSEGQQISIDKTVPNGTYVLRVRNAERLLHVQKLTIF